VHQKWGFAFSASTNLDAKGSGIIAVAPGFRAGRGLEPCIYKTRIKRLLT
jgi:hypothetical protein